MKKIQHVIITLFLFCSSLLAQDSTKIINQEVGFNTVLLIKQLISNNPSSTLDQLPYSIFYNIYFKDLIGIRVGLGFSTSKDESSIEGQNTPRTTNTNELDLRTGISYNFVRSKRITLNVFADNLIQQGKTETVNTSTTQAFPNPVQKITTTTSDKISGSGFQLGVGVKYNLYKHLSIYAEIPIGFMTTTTTSDVTVSELGQATQTTSNSDKNSQSKITIPTTIYLVLRF